MPGPSKPCILPLVSPRLTHTTIGDVANAARGKRSLKSPSVSTAKLYLAVIWVWKGVQSKNGSWVGVVHAKHTKHPRKGHSPNKPPYRRYLLDRHPSVNATKAD